MKFSYASKSEIPAGFETHYKEEGGKWVLQVEGAVDADRLREFRESNDKLLKALGLFGVKLETLDTAGTVAAELTDLRGKKGVYEGVQAKDKDAHEKLLKERTETMQAAHDKALKESEAARATLAGQLEGLLIDKEVVTMGMKHGLLDTAHLDLVGRARTTFKLVDGKLVAQGADGKAIYGTKAEPLTVEEWVAGTVKAAPHMFKPSQGGGAPGAAKQGQGGPSGENPWTKGKENMTRQGEIIRQDVELAKRLAAEAGATLEMW